MTTRGNIGERNLHIPKLKCVFVSSFTNIPMDSFNTTPKRASSLQHAVMSAGSKRSLLDRTKSATFGRIGKRLSQPQEPSSSNHFLHSIYDEEDEDGLGEPIPKAPRLTSEHFSRYEIMTEL